MNNTLNKLSLYKVGCTFNPTDERFRAYSDGREMFILSTSNLRPSLFLNPKKVHLQAIGSLFRVGCVYDSAVGWRANSCSPVNKPFRTEVYGNQIYVSSHRPVLPSQFVNPYKLRLEARNISGQGHAIQHN